MSPQYRPLAQQWLTDHLVAGDKALETAANHAVSGRHEAAVSWTNIAREHYRAAALVIPPRPGSELL